MFAEEMNSDLWVPHKRDEYHKYQRRQWIRVRERLEKVKSDECWEYATNSSHKRRFRTTRGVFDQSQRCRWTRRVIQNKQKR